MQSTELELEVGPTPCELGQFGDCQTNVELPIYYMYNVKGGPAQKSGRVLLPSGVLFRKGQSAVTNTEGVVGKGYARLAAQAI